MKQLREFYRRLYIAFFSGNRKRVMICLFVSTFIIVFIIIGHTEDMKIWNAWWFIFYFFMLGKFIEWGTWLFNQIKNIIRDFKDA